MHSMPKPSNYELPGLVVSINCIQYQYDPKNFSNETPHAFRYYITIFNKSDRTITLLKRKWIIHQEDGQVHIVEGDKIVGFTPKLNPEEYFFYNSYHVTPCNAEAFGTYQGIDETGQSIFCKIPHFAMIVPKDNLGFKPHLDSGEN